MASVTSCGSEQEQVVGVSALIHHDEEQSARLLWANVRKNERERTVAQCLSSEAWWPAWQLEEHRQCRAASYRGTQLPIQAGRKAAEWLPSGPHPSRLSNSQFTSLPHVG
jgi:hypothetical protein